jgi:hypothetical protein
LFLSPDFSTTDTKSTESDVLDFKILKIAKIQTFARHPNSVLFSFRSTSSLGLVAPSPLSLRLYYHPWYFFLLVTCCPSKLDASTKDWTRDTYVHSPRQDKERPPKSGEGVHRQPGASHAVFASGSRMIILILCGCPHRMTCWCDGPLVAGEVFLFTWYLLSRLPDHLK